MEGAGCNVLEIYDVAGDFIMQVTQDGLNNYLPSSIGSTKDDFILIIRHTIPILVDHIYLLLVEVRVNSQELVQDAGNKSFLFECKRRQGSHHPVTIEEIFRDNVRCSKINHADADANVLCSFAVAVCVCGCNYLLLCCCVFCLCCGCVFLSTAAVL